MANLFAFITLVTVVVISCHAKFVDVKRDEADVGEDGSNERNSLKPSNASQRSKPGPRHVNKEVKPVQNKFIPSYASEDYDDNDFKTNMKDFSNNREEGSDGFNVDNFDFDFVGEDYSGGKNYPSHTEDKYEKAISVIPIPKSTESVKIEDADVSKDKKKQLSEAFRKLTKPKPKEPKAADYDYNASNEKTTLNRKPNSSTDVNATSSEQRKKLPKAEYDYSLSTETREDDTTTTVKYE